MSGKIYFDSIIEVATFLKEFTGSTATFEVHQMFDPIGSHWELEFTGGF